MTSSPPIMEHEARDAPPGLDVELESPEYVLDESDGSLILAPDQGESAANQGSSEQPDSHGAAMTPGRQSVVHLNTSTQSRRLANAERPTPPGPSENQMPTGNLSSSRNPSMNTAAATSGQIPSTLVPTEQRPTRSFRNNGITMSQLPPSSAQATSSALGISVGFRQAQAVMRYLYYPMFYDGLRNISRPERHNVIRALAPTVANPWTGCTYCVHGCGYCTSSNIYNTSAHQGTVINSTVVEDTLSARIPVQSIGGNRSYLAVGSSGSYNTDNTIYYNYSTDASNQGVQNAYDDDNWNVQYSTNDTYGYMAAQFSENNWGYRITEQAQPATLIQGNSVQENIQQQLANQEMWRRYYNTPMEPQNLGSANLVPLFTTKGPTLTTGGSGWAFPRAVSSPTVVGSTHLIGLAQTNPGFSTQSFLTAAQRNPDTIPETSQRAAENSQETVNSGSTSGGNGHEGDSTKANQGQACAVLQETQVPLGHTLHICPKCMVLFISVNCTYRFTNRHPTDALLCPCIAVLARRSYLPVNPPRDPSQMERRLNAFTALIHSPSRAEDWLRLWGPYLRSTGGLTTGHFCDETTSGGMKQKKVKKQRN